jgi:hypothetical protein
MHWPITLAAAKQLFDDGQPGCLARRNSMDIQETLKAILTCYNGGDFERAQGHASNLLQHQDSAEFRTIYGALVGMSGQRQAAEIYLFQAVQNFPSSGLLFGQLAEQRARQAKWDEAAQDFIKAFALAEGEWVFRHFQTVAVGFSEAVAAGALDGEIPTKMVNILDYQGSNFTKKEKRFFALARRTMKACKPLEGRSEFLDSFLEELLVQHWAADQETSDQFLVDAHAAVSSEEGDSFVTEDDLGELSEQEEEPASPTPWDDLMEDLSGATLVSIADNLSTSEAVQEPTKTPQPPAHRRLLRERPQERFPQHARSDHNGGMPPLKVEKREVAATSTRRKVGARPSTIGITTGDLLSEIAIDESVEDALRLIRFHGTESVPLTDSGLNQLEWHAWFGRLSTDSAPIVLGGFLGRLAAASLQATWHFDEEATRSHMSLGDNQFTPFTTSQAWCDTLDKDDIDLGRDVVTTKAPDTSNLDFHVFSTMQDHDKIALQLALRWQAFGPFKPQAPSELAGAIEVEELGDDWILFSADTASLFPRVDEDAPAAAWTPTKILRQQTRTTLAFMPRLGTFFALASRKHFARFLETQFDALDDEAATRIGRWLFAYHLEGRAVGLSQQEVTSIDGDGFRAVRFPCFLEGTETVFRAVHMADASRKWHLTIET